MIQRHSPTIRRDESLNEYSPPPGVEFPHETSPPPSLNNNNTQHLSSYDQQQQPPPQQQQEHHLQQQHHQPPVKKSRGRPTKQYWTHEWSDHATEALIELWSEKEELYNKQHPLFYVKDNKDRAVEEIRDALRDRGFDVTCNNILSKFQSLRTYFCTQRTKHMAQRRASGASYHIMPDDGSECKWRFYKSLMFLDDNMKPRESHRKMELINNEYSHPPSFATSGGGSNEIMVSRTHRSVYPVHPHHHHQQQGQPQTMVEYIHPQEHPSPEGSGYLNNTSGSGGNPQSHHSNHHYENGPGTSPYDDQHTVGSGVPRDYTVTSSYADGSSSIDNKNGTRSSSSTKHSPVGGSSSTTIKVDKHEDFIFGELVGNMVHQLPSGQHKDLVKLEIQQLIIKAKYASKSEESLVGESGEMKTEIEE